MLFKRSNRPLSLFSDLKTIKNFMTITYRHEVPVAVILKSACELQTQTRKSLEVTLQVHFKSEENFFSHARKYLVHTWDRQCKNHRVWWVLSNFSYKVHQEPYLCQLLASTNWKHVAQHNDDVTGSEVRQPMRDKTEKGAKSSVTTVNPSLCVTK